MSVCAPPSDFLMVQGFHEQLTEIPILSWERNFFTTVFEGPHVGSYLVPFEFGLKLHTQFNILLKYHSVGTYTVARFTDQNFVCVSHIISFMCVVCLNHRLLLSCVKYTCIENINKSS